MEGNFVSNFSNWKGIEIVPILSHFASKPPEIPTNEWKIQRQEKREGAKEDGREKRMKGKEKEGPKTTASALRYEPSRSARDRLLLGRASIADPLQPSSVRPSRPSNGFYAHTHTRDKVCARFSVCLHFSFIDISHKYESFF